MNTVYRVVNPEAQTGLWYDKDGSWNPIIQRLGGAKSAHLPMGYDPNMRLDGKAWLSATLHAKELLDWFSIDDLAELCAMGYGIWQFEVREYRTVPGHVVITEDAIVSAVRIPLFHFLEEHLEAA